MLNEEQVQAFLQAVQKTAEAIVDALRPFMDAVIDWCRQVYDTIRAEYVVRGAIYGDTHEGLMRWFEEITTIARLRQQAEYLEQRHAMLADIRMMRL